MSMTLFYLLINSTATRSATQMLSLKDGYTIRFETFLAIGLSNYFGNSRFLKLIPVFV